MGNPRKCLAYTGKSKNKIDDLGVPPFQEPPHMLLSGSFLFDLVPLVADACRSRTPWEIFC
jgi:hypothetical protein